MSPTARARFRQRPVIYDLARGDVDRYNPGDGGNAPTPPASSSFLLETGDILLLETGDQLLLET